MRGMTYTRASRRTDDRVPVNPHVQEALAIQAANRPPKGPPKVLETTPTLPRVGKKRRRKRA